LFVDGSRILCPAALAGSLPMAVTATAPFFAIFGSAALRVGRPKPANYPAKLLG